MAAGTTPAAQLTDGDAPAGVGSGDGDADSDGLGSSTAVVGERVKEEEGVTSAS